MLPKGDPSCLLLPPPTKCRSRFSCLIVAKGRESFTQFSKFYSLHSQQFSTPSCDRPPETLDTACYTAIRNRKGHRSPDQHDRFQAWTVSSCSPNVVVIPRGWLRPSSDRQSCRSNQGRTTWRAPPGGPRRPPGRRSLRQECRRPYASEQTTGQEDHPLAAVFALLLRAAVKVRSTGARGASKKKSVANTKHDKTICQSRKNGTNHRVYPTQTGGNLPRSEPKKRRAITNE